MICCRERESEGKTQSSDTVLWNMLKRVTHKGSKQIRRSQSPRTTTPMEEPSDSESPERGANTIDVAGRSLHLSASSSSPSSVTPATSPVNLIPSDSEQGLSELEDDEDDPIVILRHLRTARISMKKSLKGAKKSAKKAVIGTQKKLAGGTHKVVKRTQQALRQSTTHVKQSSEERDLEASPLVQHESSPLIPQATVGQHLWGKARQHLDSIVLSQHTGSALLLKDGGDAGDKQLLAEEAKTRIRRGVEFSLLQCVIAIGVYLLIAVGVYSFVLEKWSVIDSLYFAVVTFTTIGYGDLVPSTDASRIFTCVFALFGVAILGVALGVLGSNLIDAQDKAVEHARQFSQYRVMTLFDSISPKSRPTQTSGLVPREVPSSQRRRWYQSAFVVKVLPLLTVMLAFSVVLTSTSNFTAVETLYFCTITAATIGFGDFTPETERDRLLAVFFILLAVGAMGKWMSLAASFIIDSRQASFQRKFENHELTMGEMEAMDDDGDGKVTRAEFLEFMLVAMNKVDQDVIDELRRQFSRLDVDGTGELEKEDLIIVAKRKMKSTKRKLQLAEYKQKLLLASSIDYS